MTTMIILDTNMLLTALENKIDIMTEVARIMDTSYSLAIIDKTLQELEGKKMGRLAQEYIKKNNIAIIPTAQDKNVDNLILDHATSHTIVATQDKKLKEKLKKRKMGIIIIRQKRYLARV